MRGVALLTVETEENGDSKSTNERGPSLVDSLGSSCRYTRFLSCLAAVVGPVENIFFLTIHHSISIHLSHRPARWEGSRAGSFVS
jgi:hypothetical protein